MRFFACVLAVCAWGAVAQAQRSTVLRAVRAELAPSLLEACRHAPGRHRVREGGHTVLLGRTYRMSEVRLRPSVGNLDAQANAAVRAMMRPDPDDEAWHESATLQTNITAQAIAASLSPRDPIEGEAAGVNVLATRIADVLRLHPELSVVVIDSGWSDEPGAAYRGVMLVDVRAHRALWIYLDDSWDSP